MGQQDTIRGTAVVAMVAVLLAAAGSLQRARERRYPDTAVNDETLYLTSGRTLQRLTAGYNTLAADLYWIRALQYFGGIRLRLNPVAAGNDPAVAGDRAAADYRLLFPLLDITTTLDP